MVRRSVLFSPGDQKSLLRKAPKSDADVIVFDLEDAVAPAQKKTGRETVCTVLSELSDRDENTEEHLPELCVRINPLDAGGDDDIQSLAGGPRPDSVMLPKVNTSEDVEEVVTALRRYNWDPPLLALLETAAGVLNAQSIAAVPETDALLFGAEDLSADTGLQRTGAGEEISYARQHVVLAASAAEVDAIDTLYTDFEDTAGLAEDTERARQFGFDGKMAIHPAQVPVINERFTPDSERIRWAQRVIDAAAEAKETESGVFALDGEMIDAPLIAQAETVLERARAAGELPKQ